MYPRGGELRDGSVREKREAAHSPDFPHLPALRTRGDHRTEGLVDWWTKDVEASSPDTAPARVPLGNGVELDVPLSRVEGDVHARVLGRCGVQGFEIEVPWLCLRTCDLRPVLGR